MCGVCSDVLKHSTWHVSHEISMMPVISPERAQPLFKFRVIILQFVQKHEDESAITMSIFFRNLNLSCLCCEPSYDVNCRLKGPFGQAMH